MPELYLNHNFISILLKIFFVLGATFYLVYLVIVVRQITVMKKTLITGFNNVINLLGIINLVMAVVLLLAFILFL